MAWDISRPNDQDAWKDPKRGATHAASHTFPDPAPDPPKRSIIYTIGVLESRVEGSMFWILAGVQAIGPNYKYNTSAGRKF